MYGPKLKDSLYGTLSFNDWDDDDESYWYARIDSNPHEDVELTIIADSPTNFLAVRNTHSTFKKLIENITSIRDQTIKKVLENSRQLFVKQKHRHSLGEKLKQTLVLFSIKIYPDLTSEVSFTERVDIDEDPDQIFYAHIDNQGNITDTGITEF